MLPILLHHESGSIARRDIIWMVDNTAALGGVIKGASGLAVSERLIALFWMQAYALDLRLWIEYIDSRGNWSDGISRDFHTRALCSPLAWHTTDAREVWAIAFALRGR